MWAVGVHGCAGRWVGGWWWVAGTVCMWGGGGMCTSGSMKGPSISNARVAIRGLHQTPPAALQS